MSNIGAVPAHALFEREVERRPGDYLADSPVLSILAVVLGLGWTVMIYNISGTLPNFINPF